MKAHVCYWILAVAILTNVPSIRGGAVLKIRLIEYRNEAGQDHNNKCCDLLCASPCDHLMLFCLDEYHTTNIALNTNLNSCSHFRGSTGRLSSGKTNHFADKSVIGQVHNPIVLEFDSWPGSIMFKVLINDHDRWDQDDPVDSIFHQLVPTRYKGSAEARWRDAGLTGNRRTHPTNLDISSLLYCKDSYYGPRCDVFCVPQNSMVTGHYTCDSNTGEKVCLSDWESPEDNCKIFANDCTEFTCKNGGTCVDLHRAYECICLPRYTGHKCQTEIELPDPCISAPCLNGGQCIDNDGEFLCNCLEGYVGSTCEYHICDTAGACLNGGTCVGTGECYCSEGFTGPRCETEICDSLDCQNGGRCVRGKCLCPSGLTGALCESLIDACVTENLTCFNGGTCLNGVCTCPEGYLGRLCEGVIDNCRNRPCLNDGTCYTIVPVGFRCDCHPGFTGDTCDTIVTPATFPPTTSTTTTTPSPTTAVITATTTAQLPPSTTTTTTTTVIPSTTTNNNNNPTPAPQPTPAPSPIPSSTTTEEPSTAKTVVPGGGANQNDPNFVVGQPNASASTDDTTVGGLAWWIWVVVGVCAALLIAIVVIAVLVSKNRKNKKRLRYAQRQNSTTPIVSDQESVENPVYHIDNVYENAPTPPAHRQTSQSSTGTGVTATASTSQKETFEVDLVPKNLNIYDVPPPTYENALGARGSAQNRTAGNQTSTKSTPRRGSNATSTGGLKTPRHLEERYRAMAKASQDEKP